MAAGRLGSVGNFCRPSPGIGHCAADHARRLAPRAPETLLAPAVQCRRVRACCGRRGGAWWAVDLARGSLQRCAEPGFLPGVPKLLPQGGCSERLSLRSC